MIATVGHGLQRDPRIPVDLGCPYSRAFWSGADKCELPMPNPESTENGAPASNDQAEPLCVSRKANVWDIRAASPRHERCRFRTSSQSL
jgi:hypothetical protein